MKIIKEINEKFKNTPDLITRKIKYKLRTVYIFYIETICSSELINNFILKNLTNPNHKPSLSNILATPNFKNINKEQIEFYLYNGFTVILYKNHIYALETKAN